MTHSLPTRSSSDLRKNVPNFNSSGCSVILLFVRKLSKSFLSGYLQYIDSVQYSQDDYKHKPSIRSLKHQALGSLSKCTNRPIRSHTTPRSEEHTSELQSLMRISYDLFCLKK